MIEDDFNIDEDEDLYCLHRKQEPPRYRRSVLKKKAVVIVLFFVIATGIGASAGLALLTFERFLKLIL